MRVLPFLQCENVTLSLRMSMTPSMSTLLYERLRPICQVTKPKLAPTSPRMPSPPPPKVRCAPLTHARRSKSRARWSWTWAPTWAGWRRWRRTGAAVS